MALLYLYFFRIELIGLIAAFWFATTSNGWPVRKYTEKKTVIVCGWCTYSADDYKQEAINP